MFKDTEQQLVLALFDISENAISEIHSMKGGLCNQTYLIDIDGKPKYILQQIKQDFPKNLTDDIFNILSYLDKDRWALPMPYKISGHYSVEYKGKVYRLYDYIFGLETKEINNKDQFIQFGKILADFHKDIGNCNFEIKNGLPEFHRTEKIIQKLQTIANLERHDVQDIIKIWNSIKDRNLFFNSSRIVHGDARYQNYLCDEQGIPFTLIDFDTLMKGSVYIDIGDLLRSVSCDRNQEKNIFKKENIDYIIEGYFSINKEKDLSVEDCYYSLMQMSIELSARFIIDQYEDSYFGWDKMRFDSRLEHNKIRALAQLGIAKSVLEVM